MTHCELTADKPSWCLTEKARTWTRESDGARLTSSQAGVLNGFPDSFPWSGSRSRQFLQASNVVAPHQAAPQGGQAQSTEESCPVRRRLSAWPGRHHAG
jgi:DNA (cytosine-5)-methyltransferase 1